MYSPVEHSQILRSAHAAVFMCFVWIWEQTAITSLYTINWLVCIIKFTARYGLDIYIYIYIIRVNFSIKRLTATSFRPNYTNKLILNSACVISSTKSTVTKLRTGLDNLGFDPQRGPWIKVTLRYPYPTEARQPFIVAGMNPDVFAVCSDYSVTNTTSFNS